MSAAGVTRWLHSRAAVLIASLLTAVCAYLWHGTVEAVVLNLGIAALMCYINKQFNLLRAMTKLQGTLFLVMEISTPGVLVGLCPGTVVCVAVLLCMMLMMLSYDDENAQRQVFLVFLILSGGLVYDLTFAIYIPVFILACAQMRIFSLRTLCAAVLGGVTPWVILIGFGILNNADLHLPDISLHFPTPDGESALLLATGGLTAFLIVTALLQNVMMKYLSYNAHSRAILGTLTVITLVTLVAAAVDYGNIYNYLPLLNCCAAMQLAHLFGAVYTDARSYIAILSIISIYLIICVWRVTASLIF